MRLSLFAAAVIASSTSAIARDAEPNLARSGPPQPKPDEAAYLAQNDAAMAKMMSDMAVQASGDVDRDFVAMMVPHHQGAIDMALAVLRYGSNEKIRRLAQEIIVTQQQEIAAMRLAVEQPLPASAPSPTAPPSPCDAAAINANTD